jgi:hypothetical protein
MLRMGVASMLMAAGGIYADRAHSAIAITWIAIAIDHGDAAGARMRVLPVCREPAHQGSRAVYPPFSGQG